MALNASHMQTWLRARAVVDATKRVVQVVYIRCAAVNMYETGRGGLNVPECAVRKHEVKQHGWLQVFQFYMPRCDSRHQGCHSVSIYHTMPHMSYGMATHTVTHCHLLYD